MAHQPDQSEGDVCRRAVLFRTTNKGESWERISPDLTTNDPAKQKQEESGGLSLDNSSAENHCTIFTIAESPLDEKIIWAGTDDGNLQLTRDGGKTWTNVVGNIQGLPQIPGARPSSRAALIRRRLTSRSTAIRPAT